MIVVNKLEVVGVRVISPGLARSIKIVCLLSKNVPSEECYDGDDDIPENHYLRTIFLEKKLRPRSKDIKINYVFVLLRNFVSDVFDVRLIGCSEVSLNI